MTETLRTNLLIAASIIVCLLLTILPLPSWGVWLRPQWTLMVVAFWVMTMPHRVGVGVAWSLGIIVDLLTGSLLGQHAFIYALVAYLLMKFHPQLRIFPMWQQALLLLVLSSLALAVQFIFLDVVGREALSISYWLSSITTMLLWPWMSLTLKSFNT